MDSDARTIADGGSAATQDPVASAGESDPTPLRVGRFFIFRQLGEGGMGQVLLAYDEALSRKLAIKLWRPRSGSDADLRARMLREAQALARLSHPNVVQVYEVDDHRGQLYLAMEYVEGRTLRAWVKERQPDAAAILGCFLQAGEGLAAAHRAGVLHRDFKPDNAVVGDDGRVRVLDFGLARADSHLADTTGPKEHVSSVSLSNETFEAPITRVGSVLGTPAYMAPEQLAGAETDARADVYSYCVALWEALHGLRPYAGGSARELAAAIQTQRPRESKRPIPGWLRAALLRGLAPIPDERWPGMEPLLAALGAGARRRRLRLIAGVALGLVVALAAGLGLFLWTRAAALAACDARGAAIDEVWSVEARGALTLALSASGQPFAVDSATRVDAILDRYAHTWSEGQALACRRAEVDGEWSAATAARADACLDERRLALAGLVEVLAEADPGAARRAIVAATSLPPIDPCVDAAALGRRPERPESAAARAEAARVGQELARARSLEWAGRYAEGLALADAQITAADALAWPPLAIDARLITAGNAASLGDRDSARTERLLEDALFLALDAGLDAMAVRAAIDLLDFSGLTLLRPSEGQRWARLARALLLRLGAERPPLEAELACSAAELTKVLGRFDEAEGAFDRCYAAQVAAFGPDHPLVAHAVDAQASLAKLRGDAPRAKALLVRALATLEPAYGPDHPTIARTLADLGQVLVDLGEFAAAEAVFRRALVIDVRAFGERSARVGSDHFDLGELYANIGRPREAREHLSLAVELYDGAPGMGVPMQIAALSDLMIVDREQGLLDEALAAGDRALALYEGGAATSNPTAAPILVERARVLDARGEAGDASEAAAIIDRVRALIGERGDADTLPTLIALGEWAQARGDLEAAAGDYARAVTLAEETMGVDHRRVGVALLRFGDLERARGKIDGAIAALTRAVDLLGQPGDPRERGEARFALARARWERGEKAEARALALGAKEELGEADPAAVAAIDAWLRGRRPAPSIGP